MNILRTFENRRYRAPALAPTMALVLASLPVSGLLSQDTPAPQPHALVGGTLISGSSAPRPNTTIVFQNGLITAVFEGSNGRVPPEAKITEIRDAYVFPGLIDSHVHLATNPSGSDKLDDVVKRLEAATRGGVTAVRDMGGDARQLAFLARNAKLGELVAPDIFYSAIVAGPEFMMDQRVRASARDYDAGAAPWTRSITSSSDWIALVREAKGIGVRAIKVYAAVTAAVMQDVTAAARDIGLGTWAHATVFPARPSDAVDSGIEVLSHAPYLIWEAVTQLPNFTQRARGNFGEIPPNHPSVLSVLDEMAARDVILDPTLFAFAERNPAAHAWGMAVTKIAWQRGVTISSGTDAIGNNEGPNLHRELELLAESGLSNAAVLQAATVNGARAIGIETTHGTIAVGKVADILVLNENPLEDISNTKSIRFVVRRGNLVSN